jgi:PAS domain S-box-containing protein
MTTELPTTERALASLELLYAIGRELAGQLDLRQLLQRVLDRTLESVGAASGSILVLDEDGQVIEGALAYDGKVHDHTAERLAATFEQGLAGWVVKQRQSALISSTLDDPRWLRRPLEEGDGDSRSAMCAPLEARGRIVGVVTLVHPQAGHFTEEDMTLLQAIADQASIAVENARLFRAEQEERSFASTLQEVARIMNSALEPSLVFPGVLEQLERVIDYDSASIFIEENGRLTLVAAKGFKDNRKLIGATLPPDPKLFTRQVLDSRTPMLLANVQEHPGWAHHADLPGSDSVQGWIGAPLVLRDQAVGVLSVDSRRANAFTPKDLQVVSAFADHAAAAVANAQLFDASQRQLVATQALAEAARAVTATLNLDEVLQRILSETMRSLQSEAASLALLADSSGALEFRNALGMGAEKVRGLRLEKGQGIAGWVAEHGEALVVPDVHADPRFFGVDEELQAQTRTIAAAPIRMQKRIIGVLEAINPREAQFSEVQLELLRGIAGLAGTAIAHAQLFSETQAARLRYAGLFEDSVDPILISDLKGRITDANHRAESFLGYSSAELLGESMLDLHEADLKRLPQDLGRLEVGQTVSYASVAKGRRDDPLPVEVYVKRLDLEKKPFLQWILRDTSERQALDELRADLTSMIFHDLRSPLGNVLSSLEVLQSSIPQDDEALQSVLAISVRSGRRLSRLIEQLLDLEQLESGQAVLSKSLGSIPALIVEAVEEIHPIAEGKGHVLNFALPASDLPQVEMDADMIRRVLINLLENAVKYSRPGGGKISVSARHGEGTVTVSVSDNGPGIAPRHQEHIFDKFARIQQGGRPKGLGLGLAFCRLAVEAHGGRIWVESDTGKGATFSFTLPL